MKSISANKEKAFQSKEDSHVGVTVLLERNKLLRIIISFMADVVSLFIRILFSLKKTDNSIVLIISLQRLGDTVFAIPAISQIIEAHQSNKIYIITFPDTVPIMKLKFPEIDYKILKKDWFFYDRKIANKYSRKLVNKLSAGTIFDLTANISSASLILTTGAKNKIGSNLRYYRKIYSHYIPLRQTPHLIDLYLDIVEQTVEVNNREKIKYHPISYDTSAKILIHPFSIRKAKEWNLKKFIQLAYNLNQNYKISLIAPEGFIEEDILNEIKQQEIPLILTSTIDELIEQFKNCSLFIGNDTGPLYIANLLAKPTFTIYGPTNPDFSKPYGEYHKVIRKKIRCSPSAEQYCFTLGGIYCNSYECMNELSLVEVEEEIKIFIKKLNLDVNKTRRTLR